MKTKKTQSKVKKPYCGPVLVKREKLHQITEGTMQTVSGTVVRPV